MRVRQAASNRARSLKETSVWDRACEMQLFRTDPLGFYSGPLDCGVNYFVLMLEQLGAKTEFSCSGHPDSPNQFYIVFSAPLKLAKRIRDCGFFNVELEGDRTGTRLARWSLRTRNIQNEVDRRNFLRMAAKQWERILGPLKALA